MNIKTIALGVGALLLLSTAWKYKDADVVQDFLHSNRAQAHPPIAFDNDTQGDPSEPTTSPQPATRTGLAGVRKCRQGAKIVYTDGECPAGSREFTVNGGAVTVVPGQSGRIAPVLGDMPQGRLPHARDVLMPDDGKANLRDQAMERVINR